MNFSRGLFSCFFDFRPFKGLKWPSNLRHPFFLRHPVPPCNPHLAGEYETEQDGDGQLAVTEEDDVEQVWVGGVLQEKPETEKFL